MIHVCRVCGRNYIRSKWCPSCYDNFGKLRLKHEPISPLDNPLTIFLGGVPRYVIEVKRGIAITVRADGVVEPIRRVDYYAALEAG